jgi:hypothetical protein
MSVGDKSKHTNKQERKADPVAESYEKRGAPEKEAERRAWATANKGAGGAFSVDCCNAGAFVHLPRSNAMLHSSA